MRHKMSSSSSHNNNTNPAKINGNQACAACKYQRRKCAPDCVLAPYFPHDRQRQFINAHRLFGVSNITKIIRKLDQPERDEAMRSVIFQSDARANDPVGGCYRIIQELNSQIAYHSAELDAVIHQLALNRAHNAQIHQVHQAHVFEHQRRMLMQNNENADAMSNYHHQHQEPFDFLQNDQQVSLQEVGSWGLQESTCSSVPDIHHNNNAINGGDDDMKPLLDDLAFDGVEFRCDVSEDNVEPSCDDILGEDKARFPQEDEAFQNAQDDDLMKRTVAFLPGQTGLVENEDRL